MPRQNLLELAKANAAHLQQRYDELLAAASADEAALIQELHNCAKAEWRVVIGGKARELLHFLDHGEPYNKYRSHIRKGQQVLLASDQQSPNETPIDWAGFEKVYEVNPGDLKFLPKRKAWNEWADQEEEFTYSALAIRNYAGSGYGYFTIVLRHAFIHQAQMTSLQGDTLQHYVDEANGDSPCTVKVQKLMQDITDQFSIHQTVCLKKASDFVRLGFEAGLGTIYTKDEYLEIQLLDQFGAPDIEGVIYERSAHQRAILATEQLAAGNRVVNEDALILKIKKGLAMLGVFVQDV